MSKKFKFVINSLLDADFYKFTMGQYFWKKMFNSNAEYSFKCRNNINLTPFIHEIQEEINHLHTLSFTKDELEYLHNIPIFEREFIEFLETGWDKFKSINVNIYYNLNGNLEINLSGNLFFTSMHEIYLLKIIHEVYSRNVNNSYELIYEGRKRLKQKINCIKNFENENTKLNIVDFGTRRAFSGDWHEEVLTELYNNDIIVGTSNVLYSKKFNLFPVGTMAHEYIQTFQSLYSNNLLMSQVKAFYEWIEYYGYHYSIMLSDTLGDDKFFKDFCFDLTNYCKGIRHDSGDPIIWGNKVLEHYKKYNVDTKSKTLVFSDGLDIYKMFDIYNKFKYDFTLVFGIGTNLTNDLGVDALQNVIKQVSVDGNPTAKLSNNPNKIMCKDKNFLDSFRTLLNL
jgi:nicotinate phosphoribosyltransferase